jgi:hypothetical protein
MMMMMMMMTLVWIIFLGEVHPRPTHLQSCRGAETTRNYDASAAFADCARAK